MQFVIPLLCLRYDAPAAPMAAQTSVPLLVNDLDLRVGLPDGQVLLGNGGPEPDRLNTVEQVRKKA